MHATGVPVRLVDLISAVELRSNCLGSRTYRGGAVVAGVDRETAIAASGVDESIALMMLQARGDDDEVRCDWTKAMARQHRRFRSAVASRRVRSGAA